MQLNKSKNLLTEVPMSNNSKFLQEVINNDETKILTEKDKKIKNNKTINQIYGDEPDSFTD